MRYLAVVDNITGATMLATPEEAEALTHINARDLASTIAEHGVCNSLDYTVLDTRLGNDLVPVEESDQIRRYGRRAGHGHQL